MAPTFETIEPHINEIREYIFGDLERITNLELGVNYMAAGIMMCACDLFGYLRYGRQYYGAKFVTDYMGQINSSYSKIGKSLYKSLRHGIVHTYETEKVQIGNKTIDFCISWRQREHFSVDRSKLQINLNIPKMLEELRAAFETYVAELRINGERRDQFLKSRQKILEGTNLKNKKEQQSLLNFFEPDAAS